MPEGEKEVNEMREARNNPSVEFRFFLYEAEGNGFTYFRSAEDRDDYAKESIPNYFDDGWDEGVENIVAGEITNTVRQTQRADRPPENEIDEDNHDQDGNYWDSDWDYRCNYELLPIEREPKK